MTRPNLIDINTVECHNYSFMISLDEWNGNCNAFDDLSTQICFLRGKKVKILAKNISSGCKCKLDSTAYNSNQKQNNDKS